MKKKQENIYWGKENYLISNKKLRKYSRPMDIDTITSLMKTYNQKRRQRHRVPRSCKRRG